MKSAAAASSDAPRGPAAALAPVSSTSAKVESARKADGPKPPAAEEAEEAAADDKGEAANQKEAAVPASVQSAKETQKSKPRQISGVRAPQTTRIPPSDPQCSGP